MANRFAQPSSNNWDWGSTAVWASTDGGSTGAAVPANSDDVYLKRGTYSLGTSNLDQSAVTLASLNILNGFGENASGVMIPTGSNPLLINATTLNIVNPHVAAIRLSGAFTTINMRVLTNGRLYLSGGSATNFYAGASGYVDIGDDVEMTYFSTSGAGAIIRADTTSPGDLEIDIAQGAVVEVKRKITTGTVEGKLIMTDAASIAASSGSANIKVGRGGTIELRSSGALASITALKGSKVDANSMPGFATVPTLSTLKRQDGSIILIPKDALDVTTEVYSGGYDQFAV